MARPTKYNHDIAEGAVGLIQQGYNLRAAASAFGVSESSLSRWRDKYPEFNKKVILATKEQNERTCRLSGVRPYKRKAYLSPSYSPEPLIKTQAEEEKVRYEPKTWLGLLIKPQPLEYEPTDPYLNPNTKCVEWIDKGGVFHTCPMWVWEEKHRPKQESILDSFTFV